MASASFSLNALSYFIFSSSIFFRAAFRRWILGDSSSGSFRAAVSSALLHSEAGSGYRRLADRPVRLALSWPRNRLTTLAEEV